MPQYFTELVATHAKNMPDKIAYRDEEIGAVTWKEYYKDINKLTNAFIDLGLKKGDKIATVLPQSSAFMNVFMAAGNMGLVVVPLDPKLTTVEMEKLCTRTNPKLLVSIANDKNIIATVEGLLKSVKIPYCFAYLGSIDGAKSYMELLNNSDKLLKETLHPTLDDPLIIIFTSGSTGIPKGGVISHRNSISIAKTSVDMWGISSEDTFLTHLPTSHVGGTHDLIAIQIYAGAEAVLMPSFKPKGSLELVQKYKITAFLGVPTMFRLIFQHCSIDDYDLNSLRLIVVSGEPSSPELINRIQASFPKADVVASWGMTETTGFFTFTEIGEDVDVICNTEGRPGPGNDMKIIKEDGTEAELNEVGEILVKGDSVIKTYLDESHNEKTFVNGWLKTGDVGFLDEENYMHFVGRLKEMFISGGYNVYPLEIESYLNRFTGVNAACILEIPDETWGEVGIAFIVPESNVALNVEDVLHYCKEGLANYKIPKQIYIRTDLPKTLVGKIAKQEIRKNMDVYMS